uniref:Uncharacterized protein n=1 Tax=candidate division WOR-3 bacterium TaxID=2052148 RepID=A0A7C6A8V1_UNCW3
MKRFRLRNNWFFDKLSSLRSAQRWITPTRQPLNTVAVPESGKIWIYSLGVRRRQDEIHHNNFTFRNPSLWHKSLRLWQITDERAL